MSEDVIQAYQDYEMLSRQVIETHEQTKEIEQEV